MKHLAVSIAFSIVGFFSVVVLAAIGFSGATTWEPPWSHLVQRIGAIGFLAIVISIGFLLRYLRDIRRSKEKRIDQQNSSEPEA